MRNRPTVVPARAGAAGRMRNRPGGTGAAGPGQPHPFLNPCISAVGLLLIRGDLDRPGRAGVDGGIDRLLRVALGVDDDSDRLVVLVERVRRVPAALPRAHAQGPVDAYLTVARVSLRPRASFRCGGGHVSSLAR